MDIKNFLVASQQESTIEERKWIKLSKRKDGNMDKFKALLCRIFGHKWERIHSKNTYQGYGTEEKWECKRCGEQAVIRRR